MKVLEHPPDEQPELTPELRELLEQRRAEAEANPDAGVPWEEAKERILRDLRGKSSGG